jgi:hypothetical protein
MPPRSVLPAVTQQVKVMKYLIDGMEYHSLTVAARFDAGSTSGGMGEVCQATIRA